jgi:Flp pilus assembly protein TadD
LAKPIAAVAEPDSVYVTGNLLDLVDLTLYQFEDAGTRELKGDQLPRRILYQVTAFDQVPSQFKPIETLNAEDWLLKAVALIGTDKENTAEEAEFYRTALALRADFPEAHNNLGAVLRTLGEGALAAEHYREALRLRPNYPEAHYNYAVLLQLRGSAAGASEHYREALRLRTDYVDAHYGYANLLVAAGELAQAEMHYQEALRLRPEYAEVHNNFAILLEEKGDTKLALKHYRRALRIRPEYPEAHYNFAIALEIDGEFEGAEAEYREALRLRTPYPEAQNNLAILLQTRGDLTGAEEHYREVLRNRPDDPETHYNFGLLLKAKGDINASEDHFRTAYDLAPPEWFVSFAAETQPETGQSSSLDSVAFTQRELEVIRLMAVGKSNRDIGQELVISLSTVAHHITNILNKTGASNRTEAVAVAVHHGLVAR